MCFELRDISKYHDMDLKDVKDFTVDELKKELKIRGLTVSGNKSDLVARLEGFLLKQEDVRCFSEDEDWDSEVEPSLNPGNQSVLDEFIDVLKSQVDSDHEKIEHLNAEVEQLKLQFKMKAYESSELTEAVNDLNSRNERPGISQNICAECKDITLDMAKVKLELAMLWCAVNTKPLTSSRNASSQTVDLPMKQPTPQLPAKVKSLNAAVYKNLGLILKIN